MLSDKMPHHVLQFLLVVLFVNIFRQKPMPKWLRISFSGIIALLFPSAVTMDDGATARVEIKSPINAAGWPELSDQILGALQSNGHVFLINPNGILFGQDARVDVNSLTASTLNLSNADFQIGRASCRERVSSPV